MMDLFSKANLLFEDKYIDVELVYNEGDFAIVLNDGNTSAYQDEASMVQILETIRASMDAMSSQQIIDYVKDMGKAKLAVRPKDLFKVVGLF